MGKDCKAGQRGFYIIKKLFTQRNRKWVNVRMGIKVKIAARAKVRVVEI